jgi:hypothetical protein
MIWWFVILGFGTLVVVCVAIALYIYLRRNLIKARVAHEEPLPDAETIRQNGRSEP